MRLFGALSLLLPLALAGALEAGSLPAEDDDFALDDALLNVRADRPPLFDCPKGVHILASGGHDARPKAYGLLYSTVKRVQREIPDSTAESIPYDKRSDDYPVATKQGQRMLTRAIESYARACPFTPIVLLGYSEGAIVTMNTLCGRSAVGEKVGSGLPARYRRKILATVVYGDETRIPHQSYDRGTCKRGEGTNPRQNPKGCATFAKHIRSYCDASDPQCCGGKNQSTHYTYPDTYNADVGTYIRHRYHKRRPFGGGIL